MASFPRRLGWHLAVVAVTLTSGGFAPRAEARGKWGLFLATSADDPVLRQRIVDLGPHVSAEEARRVTATSYNTGRELAQKWKMVSSPTFQCFLINIGARKGGYCWQFASELLLRLEALKLQTLDFHWAESDAGTDTEHNVIVVTARGQPFEQGLMLDNWRRSGRLLWGPLPGDPDHTWQENQDEANRRLNRRASTVAPAKPSVTPTSR